MMIRLFLSAFVAFLIAVLPAWAEDTGEPPVGIILAIEGKNNTLLRAGQDIAAPIKLNDRISRNDTLQTGEEGRLLIVLIDESRFTLGENTTFRIDDYAYNNLDDSANLARYNVEHGAFLYTSGKLTKKDNPDVKVTTPYGAIGIRGTSFWGGNLGSQYGVYVDEGQVSIETKRGHVFVDAGKGTAISSINSIPDHPRALPDEILSAARTTVALKDVEKAKTNIAEAAKAFPAMVEKHREFVYTERVRQLDNPGSIRKRGRGVLRIEQQRQDERIKRQEEAEAPKPEQPEIPVEAPHPAPDDVQLEPDAPAVEKKADPL